MACSKQIATASEAPEAHGNEDIPTGSATMICFVTMQCLSGSHAGSLVRSIAKLRRNVLILVLQYRMLLASCKNPKQISNYKPIKFTNANYKTLCWKQKSAAGLSNSVFSQLLVYS